MSRSERADTVESSRNQLPGELRPPTLTDVFDARRHIRPYIERSAAPFATTRRWIGWWAPRSG